MTYVSSLMFHTFNWMVKNSYIISDKIAISLYLPKIDSNAEYT